MPDDAFASPTRSTVPLLDFWRDPFPRLQHLAGLLNLNALVPATLSFEYPFPVVRGRGKASYTDLMILASSSVIGIEAKFTEPQYETVKDWLGPSPTQNRRDVLAGWLDCLNQTVGRPIVASAVESLPYQLIHRAASVCSVPRKSRFLIYQVFGPSPADFYAHELDVLRTLLSASQSAENPRIAILSCSFQGTTRYAKLESEWKSGRRDGMSTRVREALLEGPLLKFSPTKLGDATLS